MTPKRNFPSAFAGIVDRALIKPVRCRFKTPARARTIRGYFYSWRQMRRDYNTVSRIRVSLQGTSLTFSAEGRYPELSVVEEINAALTFINA